MIERRPFQSLSGHRCDWLQAKYHFSPMQPRSGWGALRIWNDDEIAPLSRSPIVRLMRAIVYEGQDRCHHGSRVRSTKSPEALAQWAPAWS